MLRSIVQGSFDPLAHLRAARAVIRYARRIAEWIIARYVRHECTCGCAERSAFIMCRECGATGDPFVPGAWLDLQHLSATCVRVQARRKGEAVPLRPSDAEVIYRARYEYDCSPPSLDLGLRVATVNGRMYTRREMLQAFVEMAGTRVWFERRYTTQGAPIFIVTTPESPYYPMRMAIGIGQTWTDAVAQALDMWFSGT